MAQHGLAPCSLQVAWRCLEESWSQLVPAGAAKIPLVPAMGNGRNGDINIADITDITDITDVVGITTM